MRAVYLYFVLSIITVINAQTSSSSAAVTPTSTSQSTMATSLPNTTNEPNLNNSSATTTSSPSAHGSIITPTPSLSSSPSASNTTRPPQFAPLPDDTVGKNGRLRVSSAALSFIPPNSYIFLFSLSTVFIMSL